MSLPPLKFTDLDKIFTEDTSHYKVPPCKISSEVPKIVCENQKMEKNDLKIVFLPETSSCYGRDV